MVNPPELNEPPIRVSDLPFALILSSTALIACAIVASMIGLFSTFGLEHSTRPAFVDDFLALALVGGPFGIAALFVLGGIVRFANRKRAWFVPVLGVPCLVLNYSVLLWVILEV